MDSAYLIDRSGNFLYHQKLSVFKWIIHGFSLRRDEISGCERSYGFNGYQSLETVRENRRKLVALLLRQAGGRDPSGVGLCTLKQIHSDVICSLNSPEIPASPPEGDGLVSRSANVLLAIQTADCMPVLIVDPLHRAVAAVHAGWRGTLQRIIQKVVSKMQELYHTAPGDCLAVVGPSIRQCCYPVGIEIVRAFEAEFPSADQMFFTSDSCLAADSNRLGASNQIRMDLPAACRHQLLKAGLPPANLFADPPCTACHRELFFSHRAEEGKCGRMISVVGVLED